MKILFLLLLTLFTFANAAHPGLIEYQSRYSLCHGKTDYQISECILNGNLNYAALRGDRSVFQYVSRSKIKQAAQEGIAYEFTMQHLPQTRRYKELKAYLDHLYMARHDYTIPRFKGNGAEDIMRMKRIFNILFFAGLDETSEITPAFEEAVLEYQRRNGLAVDGDIGPRTKRTLQQPIGRFITKLKKNLVIERITKHKPSNYIMVNIPEFKMHYYENGYEILSMKTVVGKPKMRTPIFSRKMQFVVLNPTWNVPPSIYKKEYAHLSSAQLRRIGLRYGSNGKLYQPAGRRNALGLVKFLFPNKYNVYMHDTPAKSLFHRTTRAYSHGCIRFEKPMKLLHKLGYSYHSGKTTWKTLKKKIPVFVEYHTAWADEDGNVQFRPDIYGYERKLFSRSRRYTPVKRKPKPKRRDVISEF